MVQLALLRYDVPDQDAAFNSDFVLPISIDATTPLQGHLASFIPAPPVPHTFKMRDAIQAFERHVFVEGLTDNPVAVVDSAVAALRWEFDTYWVVDPQNAAYYPRIPPDLQLTTEHVTRAGEFVAEGIALTLLEQRFNISRANCRFIPPDGNKPRLDYAFRLMPGTSLAVLHPGASKMRLEVRSRKALEKLTANDYKRLCKKKKGHPKGHTLAIYCCYGVPSSTFTPHIILADPGEHDAVSDLEAIETTLINYERATGRIGLWYYNKILRDTIRDREIQIALPHLLYESNPHPPTPVNLMRRPRDTKTYRGRYFAERLIEAGRGGEAARTALRRFQMGDTGTLTFYGLNVTALNLIENRDWLSLGRFLDRNRYEDAIVTGDGIYRRTEIPSGEDAAYIEDALTTLATHQ